MAAATFTVDIEVCNRCNAGCDFCPRDRTPHQGTMRPEVFERALARAVEFRDLAARHFEAVTNVTLCGLGEVTLHRHLPAYVAQVAAAGFEPRMCTNGSLLTEELSLALLDAGVRLVFVNCGDLGADYDRVYKVSFERMRDNVLRFQELAGDRASIFIVLVDHHPDPDAIDEVRRFWEDAGVALFYRSPMLNRSGSLEVEGMAFATYPQHARALEIYGGLGGPPACAAAYIFPFIGYDGRYYLCSSDWEKQTPMGSVFDASLFSILGEKMRYLEARRPVCATCCHDPVNRLTTLLRRRDAGDERVPGVKGEVGRDLTNSRGVHAFLERSVALGLTPAGGDDARPRRLIPVTPA